MFKILRFLEHLNILKLKLKMLSIKLIFQKIRNFFIQKKILSGIKK